MVNIDINLDSGEIRKTLQELGFRGNKFWFLVALESAIFAAFAYYLGKASVPWVTYTTSLFACAVVLVAFMLVYNKRAQPRVDRSHIETFIRIGLTGEHGSADKELLSVVADTLRVGLWLGPDPNGRQGISVPVINPANVASRLLRRRRDDLRSNDRMLLEAVHVVPPGRGEGFWWQTGVGREYFQVQAGLIAEKKLSVHRLLITKNDATEEADYLEWVAQVQAGMDVRWARGRGPWPLEFADYLLLHVLDREGEVICTDYLVERTPVGATEAFVELFNSLAVGVPASPNRSPGGC